jgi:hypothetical protein
LCAFKKVNSRQISNFQPLFAKHPGWGYLGVSSLLESITSSLPAVAGSSAVAGLFFTPSLEGLALLAQSLEGSAGCEGLQNAPDSYQARRSGGGTVPPQTALESTLAKVYQNK